MRDRSDDYFLCTKKLTGIDSIRQIFTTKSTKGGTEYTGVAFAKSKAHGLCATLRVLRGKDASYFQMSHTNKTFEP